MPVLPDLEACVARERRARRDECDGIEQGATGLALVAACARIAAMRAGAEYVAVGEEAAIGGRPDLGHDPLVEQPGRIEPQVEVLGRGMVPACYQSKTGVIKDGVALPSGDVASCRINGKTVNADFTKPVTAAAGGVTYRVGNEVLAFKRISDTMYLTQVATSGVYKFGYLLKNGDAVDVLSLKAGAVADAANQARAANILFKPAPDDWTEMVGDRTEIEAFLMGAKLGSMQSAGECRFRMAVPADAPITKLLRISTTRVQALKIPGAEECELGDVCLPLTSMAAAKLSPPEKAGFRYQVAFDPDRVHP
ncbi:UNVERIFIED_ORG: hypothetical protein M2438_000424 [Methylobacterium sp. SuP10 SLI 274]|nr:hypothetical protein [Methylorubrum extorquens]MDF9789915.1 hypothetical protein [Methylorubrum extorquens]MDF9861622.1 hypothetical protein [Methylorubrum pseudosasae]MDH6635249.1 hypothetical protein [Methylobacterium sp. SuP10 SLI 274]MDH6664419.1 hypothetical protein [Methylorubrum zatmanii]